MAKLWGSSLGLAAVGMLAAGAAFAQNVQNRVAQPGAVNYVEGSVTIDGRAITHDSVGSAQVDPGQVLQTARGKVEMLLTPGVFLRLDDNSSLKMVSNSLVNTEVQLESGQAMIEADQIFPENHLAVLDNGFQTLLLKKGLYRFDAANPSVAVYDGKAAVRVDDRDIEVGKGKELALIASGNLKPQKFDRKPAGELYAWSKLRSQYMAEANVSSAQMIYVDNPWWWYGTGWYWNPWFASWAFVPGGGYFYGPFGFGFYSPPVVYAYGGGYYRGFPGYRGYGYSGGFRVSPGPSFHSGFGGGFRGAAGGFGRR